MAFFTRNKNQKMGPQERKIRSLTKPKRPKAPVYNEGGGEKYNPFQSNDNAYASDPPVQTPWYNDTGDYKPPAKDENITPGPPPPPEAISTPEIDGLHAPSRLKRRDTTRRRKAAKPYKIARNS